MNYEERVYREYVKVDNLVKFEVKEKETDLLILAQTNLHDKALASALKHRKDLEEYIESDPHFMDTLSPCHIKKEAPLIVQEMAEATHKTKVGPMAAVAGTLAELVGKDLLEFSKEVIVENGGDIFLKTNKARKIGVFAGNSPFSGKIALEFEARESPFSVCTSSGTVGPSFSFGKADAVVVIAQKGALADAAATAIGNEVKEVSDIDRGLKLAKKIHDLEGVLIIKEDQMGALGKIKITSL